MGKYYNNLRYADDVTLLATTEENLQQLVNDVGKASERFGLSLNAKKNKIMVIGRHNLYNGAPLEQVNQLIYLGASSNENGYIIKNMKTRVDIAKRANGDLHMIMEEQRATNPTEEKTCTVNDMADNELG